MRENNISAKPCEIADVEESFSRWKQRYQQHQEMLDQFFEWQEVYRSQLLHYREKQRIYQDMHEDLKREINAMKYRRATSLSPHR